MLQTDYVIGSPLNHQDPFIQRHGSQLTANEPPPFRQPFTSRRGIRLAYSFPGPARGDWTAHAYKYRKINCTKTNRNGSKRLYIPSFSGQPVQSVRYLSAVLSLNLVIQINSSLNTVHITILHLPSYKIMNKKTNARINILWGSAG